MHAATTRSSEVAELAAMAEQLARRDEERDRLNAERDHLFKESVRANRRLRAALDLAPIGLMIVQDRHVLLANRRLAEITGYSEDELQGESTRVLYATEDDWLRAPGTATGPDPRTVLLRRKDGGHLECRMSCAIVDHADREWVVSYLDPCAP